MTKVQYTVSANVDGLEKTLDEFKSEVYYTLNGIKDVLSEER